MAKVLVVGGAGYVGSATCARLLDSGHEVWVLDDLSTGHRELVLGKHFLLGRGGDSELLCRLLARDRFDCVMHFAAYSLVSESFQNVDQYFENNVQQTERLLESLIRFEVRNFIFSSSCAIFGDPGLSRITEFLPKNPVNPYGETKLAVEKLLEEFAVKNVLKSITLRYFNAVGAEPHLRVGEWHKPETHLIPAILKAASNGEKVDIFGTDYLTPDGTCIRDYIHVWDLAAAHEAAMNRLLSFSTSQGLYEAFNLGSEKGFSVREVIQACESVTGKEIQRVEKSRRRGDLPFLVADSRLAREVLGFSPAYTELQEMIASAWEWEKKREHLLRRAIFLDRDGTINEDPGYLRDPDQLKLLPGVGEALALLKRAGYLLVVVSNQSGVSRGLIPENKLPQIHQKLDELLQPFIPAIDRYELCLHHPDDQCACRKPKPKLLLDAAYSLKIDVSKSYMVGDKGSDLAAGYAAGCQGSVLVRTGTGKETEADLKPGQASFIAETLLDAAYWILSQENVSF